MGFVLKKLILLFTILYFCSTFVNAQEASEEYSKQDRISVFYAYNFDEEMNNWYFMNLPHLDIRYRMTNYSNELDYFSFTGKLGIQGFYAYLHFGPEIKFFDIFYMNLTFGIYGGYMLMGFIGEAELGFKINIIKHLYVEGVGSWQSFTSYYTSPSLKIGLGIDF